MASRGRGLLVLLTAVGASAQAPGTEPSVQVLMDSARTVLEQPFAYPVGEARLLAVYATATDVPGTEIAERAAD